MLKALQHPRMVGLSQHWLKGVTRHNTQIKSKKVRINREMMPRMTVGVKLSRRAVMKE